MKSMCIGPIFIRSLLVSKLWIRVLHHRTKLFRNIVFVSEFQVFVAISDGTRMWAQVAFFFYVVYLIKTDHRDDCTSSDGVSTVWFRCIIDE